MNFFQRQFHTESEQSLLRCFIEGIDRPEIRNAFELMGSNDFYHAAHSEIFNAIAKTIEQGTEVDIVSIMSSLPEQRNTLLAIEENAIGAFANVAVYARIVKEKAIERGMQDVMLNALDSIGMTNLSHSEKLDRVHAQLKDLNKLTKDKEGAVIQLKEHLKEAVNEISEKGANESIRPLQTGYFEVDTLTGGFGAGELITLGARTSVGKSALGMNIAENVSRQGKRVLYITMEMTGKDLAIRSLCSLGRVDNAFLREDGQPSQSVWDGLTRGVKVAADLPLFIAKMARPTVEEIKALTRSFHRNNPIDLIVIDHLHLMSHGSHNEVVGIGNSTAELKGLALEIEVPILMMAQLNRGNAKENRAPTITDLRGSGAIEQDSDRVLLLHRTAELDQQGISKLMLVKSRGGKSKVAITLKNNLQFYRFDNPDNNKYSGYTELVDD